MIIETLANQTYRVRETGNTELAHVWWGTEVKRVRGEFVAKKNAREILVRKTGATVLVVEAR